MRLKKPTRAIIDQVPITREGNDAIIDYADAGIAGTRLTIGPDIATMTDLDIIETVTEEPPGEKQIDYHADSDQWVPRRRRAPLHHRRWRPRGRSHHPYRRQGVVTRRIRPDAQGSCGLGYEDRVRA